MDNNKRDKTKVDPLSGAEEAEQTAPLRTLAPGEDAKASNVVIPGTGNVVRDITGKEVKRVVPGATNRKAE